VPVLHTAADGAVFNTTFAVTPTVTLRAGVRFTHDNISINNFYALEGGLEAAPVGNTPDGGITWWTPTIPYAAAATYTQFSTSLAPQVGVTPTFGENNNNVSVRVGADWKPVDDILVYGSFSQGYRGAAFNGQAFNAPAELNFAAPEKLNSFEMAGKPGFAAGAWIKNMGNRQYLAYGLAQRDPSQGGLGFDYALVGEPRTYGLDLTYRF